MTDRPTWPTLAPLAALLPLLSTGCVTFSTADDDSVSGQILTALFDEDDDDDVYEDTGDDGGLLGDYGGDVPILIELNATPRDREGEDEVFGFGIYKYGDVGEWGGGLQLQSTFRGTDPELEVVQVTPAGELEPRNSELALDFVGTYRLTPRLGVFAGAGLVTVERYRRFIDAVGNDFFVRTDRDYRGNATAGIHVWATDWLALSAQYDSYFDAATFGIGFQF